MNSLASRVLEFGRMIKFEHTIFALPFALVGLVIGSGSRPHPMVLGWILVAAVSARTAAMGFNRLVDQEIDALNPRTKIRSLPAQRLSRASAWIMVILAVAAFFGAAGALNPLCLKLAPGVLVILLGYSYTKRFTTFCHLILGLSLSCAPLGAYVAVTGGLDILPILIAGGVCFWTAGFDILYALQDQDFDRAHGLHSIPVKWGAQKALYYSRFFHCIAWLLWALAAFVHSNSFAWVGLTCIGGILIREQWILRKGDLSRLDEAFFQLNAWVGPIFFLSFSLPYLFL